MLPEIAALPDATADRLRDGLASAPALKLDTTVTVMEKPSTYTIPPPPTRPPHSQKTKTKDEQKRASPKPTVNKSVHSDRDDRTERTTTPVMLSIFPTLSESQGPLLRLKAPTEKQPLTKAVKNGPQYSPSLYSQPASPPQVAVAGDRWTVSRVKPAVLPPFQSEAEPEATPQVSPPDSVLDLWTMAQGQGFQEASPTYNLLLKCKSLRLNSEIISLAGNNNDLYTAEASGRTISIMRNHPSNPELSIKVMSPTYESPTTITPILAALHPLLAGNQGIDSALQNATEVGDSESGALLWDSDSSKYYFTIPLLTPQSGNKEQKAALAIEHIPGESIEFFNESAQSLFKLDLDAYAITLHTKTIINLSSSTHTLDILMSALLVLLIHLGREQGILSLPALAVPYFEPPPKTAIKGRSRSSAHKSVASRATSKSHGTTGWISRLNPYARTQSRLAQSPLGTRNGSTMAFDKDIELGLVSRSTSVAPHHIPPMTSAPIGPNGIAPELRASNTGVDLSKFQAYDLEDPDLGAGTKIALRVIYWGFAVVVWVLGTFVGILAAVVVVLGGVLGHGTGSREG